MFFPEQQVRVFLYGQPVDMRRSYDGLVAIARHGMQADPLAGHLLAFINRSLRKARLRCWNRCSMRNGAPFSPHASSAWTKRRSRPDAKDRAG